MVVVWELRFGSGDGGTTEEVLGAAPWVVTACDALTVVAPRRPGGLPAASTRVTAGPFAALRSAARADAVSPPELPIATPTAKPAATTRTAPTATRIGVRERVARFPDSGFAVTLLTS